MGYINSRAITEGSKLHSLNGNSFYKHEVVQFFIVSLLLLELDSYNFPSSLPRMIFFSAGT